MPVSTFGPGKDPVAFVSSVIKLAGDAPVAITVRDGAFQTFVAGKICSVVDFDETSAFFTLIVDEDSVHLTRLASSKTARWTGVRGNQLHIPRLGRSIGNVRITVCTGEDAAAAYERTVGNDVPV